MKVRKHITVMVGDIRVTLWDSTLKEIVGRSVGYPVHVCRVPSARTGVGKHNSYSIVPATGPAPGVMQFWRWHVDQHRQYWVTPLAAAAAFVRAWRRWIRERRSALKIVGSD